MPHSIIHISGPAGSGKTLLIRRLSSLLRADRIYHIRFDLSAGDGPPMLRLVSSAEHNARVMHCYVRPELVFETFADVLPRIAQPDESAIIFVETNSNPCFRHAFPYDVKVFQMTAPKSIEGVFRTADETAGAIHRAMHDTAEFAAELFGLDRLSPHDSALLPSLDPHDAASHDHDQSVDEFLNSPMGTEISVRMQLRPEFQGIIDADVVFLNNAIQPNIFMENTCVARIEELLDRLRHRLERRSWFAACDPLDGADPKTAGGWRLIVDLLAVAKTETS